MLRWWLVPAATFMLAFGVSFAGFEVDGGGSDLGRAAPAPAGSGDLVVTYTPHADDADHGYLGTVALDGSDLKQLIEPRPSDTGENEGSPSVSPDGRTVAFQRAAARENAPGVPYVYVMPLDGSKPERRVADGHTPEVDPSWSPDGRRLAFARQMDGSFDIFSSRLDGSRAVRLTHTPGVDELSPAWSPDGSKIAFSRYENGLERGSGDLWIEGADGRGPRRLLGDEHDYSAAAWSPEGGRIALLKDSLVAVVSARGGVVRPLTPAGQVKETRPSWSPDGRRLAFTRDPGKILTMKPDGSDVRRVPFDRAANGVDWVPAS